MASARELAKKLAKHGRNGDTELVHMSKAEVRTLTALGELTVNPKTGLKEAFKLSRIFSNPVSLALTAAAIFAGPEILAGLGGEAAAGAAAGGVTAGGASIAGLSALGAEGAATYGAMEGLAGSLAGAGAGAGFLNTVKSIATLANPAVSLLSAIGNVSAAKRVSAEAARKAPAVEPAIKMPIIGDQQSMSVLRANLQQQMFRRGRAASILTDPASGDKLGG